MNIQQFDYSIDILQALLWEYNNASSIQSLISQKQEWYTVNQTQFWEDWYNNVFNLVTANDFGLAVWAIILNIPLYSDSNTIPFKVCWGFDATHKNFDRGNFKDGRNITILTTEEKRLVLRLRYFDLVTRGAIPEINTFLADVFESFGTVYALDGLRMTMVYVFEFLPSSQLLTVLTQYDILPRPATVGIKYVNSLRPTFGFDEFHRNFDRGTFIDD